MTHRDRRECFRRQQYRAVSKLRFRYADCPVCHYRWCRRGCGHKSRILRWKEPVVVPKHNTNEDMEGMQRIGYTRTRRYAMQGFQQRTAGSFPVCRLELKIDAITTRGADSTLEQGMYLSIVHGR